MAASRKLQEAIDRNLKKVAEGVQAFDDLWDKFYSSSSSSHREKFEAELKKEIKKLQRLRDEIKKWINGADVKDKSPLLDARKLIEKKMESFKVCEREAKTKAYSKEGLSQQPKLDPSEQKLEEAKAWVTDVIDRLGVQVEAYECQLEDLSAGSGGEALSETQLEDIIGRHRMHVEKLEVVLRLLDNHEVSSAEVERIKDDVEYYMESHIDEFEYVADEDIYEEILQSRSIILDTISQGPAQSMSSSSKPQESVDDEQLSSYDYRYDRQSEKDDRRSDSHLSASQEVVESKEDGEEDTRKSKKDKPKKTDKKSQESRKPEQTRKTLPSSVQKTTVRSAAVPPVIHGKTFQDVVGKPPRGSESSSQHESESGKRMGGGASIVSDSGSQRSPPLSSTAPGSSLPKSDFPPLRSMADRTPPMMDDAHAAAPGSDRRPVRTADIVSPQPKDPRRSAQQFPPASTSSSSSGPAPVQQSGNPTPREDRPGAKQTRDVLRILEQSLQTIPQEGDGDRPVKYVAKNPYRVHESFPMQPPSDFEDPTLFEKFDVDTLFFIFYYQHGTYQQYLAARELKRKRWRFHKKYFTWFLRHSEPEEMTDTYEKGTYVYFDFETGWCQRIKSDFEFKYEDLEDEL
eukprot:TRINITY_DN1829_c0_g1_i1.p1 TRINITY_DN1829_c0_g1~~TRINITY_DN1829_c0_g1_i1.p1  ORF type:complete len:629 (+),score=158.58 TRINITY_DN1829_c0_g1_i1:544-2430(+)